MAIVPARAGSKRLPNKNNQILIEKTLVEHTISEALKCNVICRVILTSDDPISLAAGRNFNDHRVVCYPRPKHLASDHAKTIDVLIDALQHFNEAADTTVILLQTTSPLRTANDIDDAVKCFFCTNAKSLASITETKSVDLKFPVRITKNGCIKLIKSPHKFIDADTVTRSFELNGALYITSCWQIMENHTLLPDETIPYFMPSERSIDVDTLDDLKSAREFLKTRRN